MGTKTGIQAALIGLFMSSTAIAAPEFIPGHIHLHLDRMVKATDVVALIHVKAASHSNIQVRVERSFGTMTLPIELTVSTKGFAKADIEQGSTLLVGFKRQANGTYVAVPKRYEVLFDGKIREYEAQAFLSATQAAEARKTAPSITKPMSDTQVEDASPAVF